VERASGLFRDTVPALQDLRKDMNELGQRSASGLECDE
jgi:hypothetical protein